MRKKLTTSLLLICLLVGVAGIVQANNEPIKIAECNWPGIRAKNAVAEYVLETVGYQVESNLVSDPVAHRGVASGRLDIHMGSWMPSMVDLREKLADELDVAATNMDEGLYTMAVPEYVWEAGVKSFADLNKYADKFNRKMFVGPTGWQSGKVMNRAVKNDIYSLGDWETVNSTQGALMARMKKAIQDQEWIIFVAWKPHWMNYILDIKYLKDPEGLWESPESRVDTLARKGLKEERPEVYQFFKQFKVSAEASNGWIYKIGQEGEDAKPVAEEWVQNNPEIVTSWLEGVKASNGEPAVDVFKAKIN